MSVYEASVIWGNDRTSRRKVKVEVPDGTAIFPYVIEKAMNISDDQREMKVISVKKLTCDGCIYDAPGQMKHMGPGGCLERMEESDSL